MKNSKEVKIKFELAVCVRTMLIILNVFEMMELLKNLSVTF